MITEIEFKVIRKDGRTSLCVPEVGLFTRALPAGALVVPGQHAGYLLQLGIGHALVVPAGVTGRIASERPERVLHPVGYGDVIYELEPIEAGENNESSAAEADADLDGAMILSAPHTGRFWHRPSPDDPAFCKVGDLLTPGAAVGLIEIMKTFTQIGYTPTGSLPERAKVIKMLAGDGEDVTEGSPLVEVEPA